MLMLVLGLVRQGRTGQDKTGQDGIGIGTVPRTGQRMDKLGAGR